MDMEKLTERARGFVQAAQTIAIREQNQQLETQHLLKALLDDREGLAASLLTAAGMTISSSQVLPSKEESGLERIPLSVRAEGDIVALQGALVGMAEQRPAVLLDAINIQAQGVPERGVQRLSVQFNFLILRRLSS